ncbi:nucleotidyl transferase AbiEii/AbiGii toxin family protein [Cupriavidus consociatus]|uniref:nucleotidyl transferase AbiEii/AbiGii toxin family protein n=1 Tax=Cupriavidus consociatus TaxID=2821357 RepID=UPI001AEA3B55|nr:MULTISPECIES: nucleotidyl transferase AbiEii/AbiGii toxin family protein [unclassified Cupriavidus]MBP0624127.1 nucleotidyl transferase AbiEii/AbiGii toxin family protein [Cupriavidus sp. LEh25]MDK2660840.1 nucleotidyl transferase AbiEii/AbiGii toxin family protein [Cupriavidus sp. LEh21]
MKVELQGDIWESLFPHAFTLMEEARKHGGIEPFWTFGGGTVLMLRYRHRFSRDIDLFVPDPQYLGFVTPRLSETAESITSDYVEQGNFVKLVLDAGEVDIVASPNLTEEPFEIWEIMGRPVKVETAAEIVAKKLYHRGDRATARDLFDMAVVVEQEPTALVHAAPFLLRHASAFLNQVQAGPPIMREQFSRIQRISFNRSFDECVALVGDFLHPVLNADGATPRAPSRPRP